MFRTQSQLGGATIRGGPERSTPRYAQAGIQLYATVPERAPPERAARLRLPPNATLLWQGSLVVRKVGGVLAGQGSSTGAGNYLIVIACDLGSETGTFESRALRP